MITIGSDALINLVGLYDNVSGQYANSATVNGVLNDSIVASHDPRSHPLFGHKSHNLGIYNRLVHALLDTPRIREMYLRRLRTVMDRYLNTSSTPASVAAC